MTLVSELRERGIAQPAERSGPVGTILFGVVAFALGVGAIMAWKWYPGSNPPPVASAAQPAAAGNDAPAPKFSGNRIGRAGSAPLLRTCIKGDTFEGFGNGNPEAAYTMLTSIGTMSRLAPLFGAETGDGAQFTEYWREIADCVFQQNSWHLCDADNRALAVESAGAFIRNAERVAAKPPKTRDSQMILGENGRARQRVLDALRARLRNGQLIAADFNLLQPPEIKSLLDGTKPVGDGCAKT
jgi:hypothetical protein